MEVDVAYEPEGACVGRVIVLGAYVYAVFRSLAPVSDGAATYPLGSFEDAYLVTLAGKISAGPQARYAGSHYDNLHEVDVRPSMADASRGSSITAFGLVVLGLHEPLGAAQVAVYAVDAAVAQADVVIVAREALCGPPLAADPPWAGECHDTPA